MRQVKRVHPKVSSVLNMPLGPLIESASPDVLNAKIVREHEQPFVMISTVLLHFKLVQSFPSLIGFDIVGEIVSQNRFCGLVRCAFSLSVLANDVGLCVCNWEPMLTARHLF
jgi:hypothetical protein